MTKQKTQAPANGAIMRDSNIELFRIIAMFFIVAHHYVVNSGLTELIYKNPLLPQSLFLALWGAFGKIGINCFVMITGYFMCRSNISAKKFAKLFLEVMFYKVVVNSVFWITGYAPFTWQSVVKRLVPFTSVAHNFTGTFLLFFLCIPFLNVLVRNLTEKQHVRLLLLTALIYVFFGTVPGFSVTMNYVSWYMVLYFTAAYIRLYPKKLFENTRFWGFSSLICVLLCCLSVALGCVVKAWYGVNLIYRFVTDSNTLLAYLTGICTFMFFKNVKVKPSKVINTVSATTFGVLMIHANSEVMRRWLWRDTLQNKAMFDSDWVYLHAVLSVVVIFIVCAVIDMLRIRLIEKPFFVWWDKHYGGWEAKWSAWEDKLCHKFRIGQTERE